MPIHQAEDQVDNAREHITWLKDNFPNIVSMRVDLTETFETLKTALPEIENEEVIRYMAYVNTRSRLRANILYAIANEKNGIVLGTGNRVEDYGI
jgi:NAD+ synthase